MTRNYTVIRQKRIESDIERCWRALTDPVELSSWFAGTDRFSPGQLTRFEFGDGDYFSANAVEWDIPVSIRFNWRFMDLGATSQIRYSLLPFGTSTEVSVEDRGLYSARGALELCEGWEDFLARLDRFVTTGQNSRYRWSETIGLGAILKNTPPPELYSPNWWRGEFPSSDVNVENGEGSPSINLVFHDPNWDGVATQARIQFVDRSDGTGISVTHKGWEKLPEHIQLAERRKFAEVWRGVFGHLESQTA
jgi:uncharacterized protein YndB with AHSA1/START domain